MDKQICNKLDMLIPWDWVGKCRTALYAREGSTSFYITCLFPENFSRQWTGCGPTEWRMWSPDVIPTDFLHGMDQNKSVKIKTKALRRTQKSNSGLLTMYQSKIMIKYQNTHRNHFLNFLLQIFDFQLTPEEMLQLNSLDLGENGRIINFMFWKG